MTLQEFQKLITITEPKLIFNRKRTITIIEEIKDNKYKIKTESVLPRKQSIIKGDFLYGIKYTIDNEEYYFWMASNSAYLPPHSIASGKKEGEYIYVISKEEDDDLQFNILDNEYNSIYNNQKENLDSNKEITETELTLIQKGIESVETLVKTLLNPYYEREKVKERKWQ